MLAGAGGGARCKGRGVVGLAWPRSTAGREEAVLVMAAAAAWQSSAQN